MKKILLFLTLFTAMLTFGVRAQVPVLTESFEGTTITTGWTTIDADQDGHGWEHSSLQEDVTGHTGDGCVLSYSYDNPSEAALTPDNWLISPAIALSGTSSLSYWFAVATSYPGDHYGVYVSTTSATDTSAFTLLYEMTPTSANGNWTQQTIDLTSYAGNTVYIAFRHFNCTDMFILALDDITVSTTSTDPTLVATPSTLDFGIVYLGESAVGMVDVAAYNNTSSISVSVTAPFAVSTDSLTFGTSATLPATGGVLYVQYTPVAEGASSAVMTLTAGTLSATVNLSGTGLDCSPLTLPYTETFETTSTHIPCWTVSGNAAWGIGTGDYSTATGAYEGSYNAKITHSSTGNISKLISPVLGTNNGVLLHFAYVMRSWSGDVDELRVYSRSSENGAWQQVAEYTDATTAWTVASVIVPGPVYQIAFEMTDNYGFGVGLDSVVFAAMAADFCSPVTALTAGNITETGATLSWSGEANSYTIVNMANGSVVATQDGTSYSITGLTAMTQYTYGVVANCATTTSDTVTVTFSTACTAVTLPYTETFAATSATRDCWDLVATGNIGGDNGMGFVTADGREVLRFSSYSSASDYNQYGFSPLMNVSSTATFLQVNVTYATRANDYLYFGYITPTDTVWDPTAYNTNSTNSTFNWETATFVIPANATQLAVHYYGNFAYYAWIDSVVVTELTGEYCFPVTNLAASDITAHTATISWDGDANTYTIINMATGTVVATQADSSYSITGLASETQYTYGVVANCTSTTSDTVTVTFTTAISCPVPTGLAVSLTPGNGTVATLSWTENGTATAWQICVNNDETNLIDVTSPTYSFTGLTAEQAYTVKVRANCDVDDQSVWSAPFTFTPTNAYVLTVNDGTVTNGYVPIYGYWADNITKSQFIIPAADLAYMQYGTINKLTFYSSNDTVEWGAAEFDVYLTETNSTTLSELADYTTMTQVYAGTLSILGNKMEVTLTTPYLYMGGNLMVGFLQTVSGTYHSCTWYGVEATGASMGGYGTSIAQRNFLPKTTIAYTPGTAPSCMPVTNLTVANITDTEATLTWDGTAASYSVYVDADFVANVTTTTYTVTGLTPATGYTFGVRAVCSATDSSMLSNVAATTECADVTALPYNEGFENGLGCWTTLSGTSDGQPWNAQVAFSSGAVTPHTGSLMAASWSWNSSAMHANAWLISPKFVLPNTTEPLTLTWWERTNPAYPDHYSVAISTTTNDTAAFTTVVRPYDTAAGSWTIQTVDLSTYAGQSIYIAFHHQDYDENYLLIDDISLFLGSYIPPAPDTLTVTFAVNDATMGTTNPAPGTYQYITGDTVTFTALPNPGYHFTGWEWTVGTEVDTLPASYISAYFPASAMMSYGNMTLSAIFEVGNPDSTTITYAVNDPTKGTTVPAPGTYTVYVGNSIDATAIPNTGCDLSAWVLEIYLNGTLYSSDTAFSTDTDFENPMHFGTLPQTFVDNGATITITAIFTGEPVETCEAPTGLTVGAVTHESIVVSWDNADVTGWNVRYKVQNGTWSSAATSTNSYTINGLAPETAYEIQVQANCGDGNLSDWSTSVTATTTVGVENHLSSNVTLYPNPAREYVDIRVDGDVNVTMMEVYDVYGKLVNTVSVIENPTRISVNGLADGMYFVRVTTETGSVTKSFIKK